MVTLLYIAIGLAVIAGLRWLYVRLNKNNNTDCCGDTEGCDLAPAPALVPAPKKARKSTKKIK